MTPEQEYEEAVEIVAEDLNYGIVADLERGWTPWHELDEHGRNWHRKAARAILSLTWPSGQPMIGVISQDQRLRIPKVFVVDAQTANHMLTENFRRVLLPEEKR